MILEDYIVYIRPNIRRVMKFWQNKSLRGDLMDKGGSFNLELYLRYLDVINEQVDRPALENVNANSLQK